MNILFKVIVLFCFISCKTRNNFTLKNKDLELNKVVWLEANYVNIYCSFDDLIEEVNSNVSFVQRIDKVKLDSSLNSIIHIDSVNVLNHISPEFMDVINYSYITLIKKNKAIIYYTNNKLLLKKVVFGEELISHGDTPYYSVFMKNKKGELLLQAYHKSYGCSGVTNPRFR